MRTSLLTILCLMLMSISAMAGATLYDNGPWNGQINAWAINQGFAVSDSYMLLQPSEINDFHFAYWDASSTDVLSTVDMQFGMSPFTGTVLTYPGTNTLVGTSGIGFLFVASFTLSVPSGTSGFVTLSNACTTSGCGSNQIFWDENSGANCGGDDGLGGGCPSTAFDQGLNPIPSEAFTITGGTLSVPESSNLAMLLGFGIFNVAAVLGVRRRKLI